MTRKVILISGKRKSGKDFISEKLLERIGKEKCTIIRISEPIKSHFAEQNNLNLTELMSNNFYKETYRREMIQWSEEIRKKDPGYFCKLACDKALTKPIWIVSDVRRKTDIEWFQKNFNNVITIRIMTDDITRKSRGFIYTIGIDDVASECDLDNHDKWDLTVINNSNTDSTATIENLIHSVEC